MIRDTTRLYRKFYQKRVKATVLYATETGRSRSYANIVKDVFGKVFAAKVGRGRVEEGGWVKSGGESRGGGRRVEERGEGLGRETTSALVAVTSEHSSRSHMLRWCP